MNDVSEYLQKCMNNCTSRIAEECFFKENDLQRNALRVESLRDMSPRCGEKMPEYWHENVKKRGWGIWIFSGGSASVFGYCDANCPRKNEFLRTAPYKSIRALATE